MILLRSLPFCILYFNFLHSQCFSFHRSESETSSASSSSMNFPSTVHEVDEFYFSADEGEEMLPMSSARVVKEVLHVDVEGDLALRALKGKQKVIAKNDEGALALRTLKGKEKVIGKNDEGDLALRTLKGKQKVIAKNDEGDLALRTLKGKEKVIGKNDEDDLALRTLKGKQKVIDKSDEGNLILRTLFKPRVTRKNDEGKLVVKAYSTQRVVLKKDEADLALRTLKGKQKVIGKNDEGDQALRALKGKQKVITGDLAKGKQKVIDETSQTLTYYCAICMDEKSEGKMFRNQNCSHLYCNDCIGRHVAAKIQENILTVKCPEPKCKGVIESQNCRSIIPKEVLDRWEDALCENVVNASQKFYCPFKDCSAMMIRDSGDSKKAVTISECPHCNRLFCAECKVPWHPGANCNEFKIGFEGEMEDQTVMKLAKSKSWKRCPKCNFYVERIDGCTRISCRCGNEFCYACGMAWSNKHYLCKSTPTPSTTTPKINWMKELRIALYRGD